jgi:hypothetical protein
MSLTEPKPAPPRYKLRWYQYSLRSLFLVTLLASIGMSFVAVRMQRAREQKALVAAIERTGGCVDYDYQVDGPRTPGLNSQPPGPAWLRQVLGIDFFADVVRADVDTDSAMKYLKGFPRLHTLALYRPEVTDAGMAYLDGLPQLQAFSVNGTRVTEAGLKHLKSLPRLHTVALLSSPFTDASLEQMKSLTQLDLLVLDRTKVTDEGVKKLQQALPNCKIVR